MMVNDGNSCANDGFSSFLKKRKTTESSQNNQTAYTPLNMDLGCQSMSAKDPKIGS